ncbi:MAG: hypothetical protein E4H36_13935, partial [Spirochaetales bacterium]
MKPKIMLSAPAALLIAAILALFSSCSVIFTSSLTGMIVDNDDYENAAVDPGINDVSVYLYMDEAKWQKDFDAYTAAAALPEASEKQNYYLKTLSNINPASGYNGVFSFDNVTWNAFFPKYGSKEDDQEIFFLYYHENYGMTQERMTIMSNSNVTVGPVLLTRTSDRIIRYGGQLTGMTLDGLTATSGVEVKLYVDRDAAPVETDTPDYATYSTTDTSSGTAVSGVFGFLEVVWEDIMNARRYSEIDCYIITKHASFGTKVHGPIK